MGGDDDLERRLDAVESQLEIIRLEASYPPAADAGDGEAWAALFIPDGIYQSRSATESGGGIYAKGRDALARVVNDGEWTERIHCLFIPQITLDGDRATGRTHYEWMGRCRGENAAWRKALGFYDVRYQRHEGRWLIAHRVTSVFWSENNSLPGYPRSSAFDDVALG